MQADAKLLDNYSVDGADPLIRTLRGRLGLSPWGLVLASLLFAFFYMGGLSWAFGYLIPAPGILASSADAFNILNFFVIFPAIAFYYMWQPSKIARTCAALLMGVDDRSCAPELMTLALRRIAPRKAWWIVCLFAAVLGIGAGIVDNVPKLGSWWYAANWWMVAGMQLSRGFVFYMIAAIYARHVASAIELRMIYKELDVPSPILPTSQGRGIRAVAHYAMTFSLFVAVLGLNIGLTPVLSSSPEPAYPYEAALYLIVAVVGFFLPLWSAHGPMANAKSRIMDALSNQYQCEYNRLLATAALGDQQAEESLKRLKAIETAYDLAKKSWTWPFDTGVLVRVGGTIAAPFALAVAESAQKLIGDLLSGSPAP